MGIRNLKSKLQVEQTDEKESAWSNIDLQPTSPEDRNWSPWYFFAFQFSIAFSPTTFNLGASLVAIGLNWWTIVIASFIGTFCCMIILFFNSRGAAIYHVGFPVYLRICSGFYGSLFFIFIRGVVAVLYMGTQTYYASRLINVSLWCIFGHKWTDIPNQLPESASITSSGLLAFFIFWIIQFPFAWLHPSKAGPVFAVKSWLTPPTYIATMIWAVAKAKGAHMGELGTADATGSELAWSFMKAINSVVSGVIPPLVNIPDLARYAKEPRATWPMVAGLLISKPLVIIFGMVTTSASVKLFNEVQSSPPPFPQSTNTSTGILESLGLLQRHPQRPLVRLDPHAHLPRLHHPSLRHARHQRLQQCHPRRLRPVRPAPALLHHPPGADHVQPARHRRRALEARQQRDLLPHLPRLLRLLHLPHRRLHDRRLLGRAPRQRARPVVVPLRPGVAVLLLARRQSARVRGVGRRRGAGNLGAFGGAESRQYQSDGGERLQYGVLTVDELGGVDLFRAD